MDEYRAESARTRTNYVLKCGIEETRISHRGFGLIFLNPPYDWQSTEDEADLSERKEKVFLNEVVKYLKPDGLLVYIIPQRGLTKSIAKILAYRFYRFMAYRFPDGEYEEFKQMALRALKNPKSDLDEKAYGSCS